MQEIVCGCGGRYAEARGWWYCGTCGEGLPQYTAEDARDPARFMERQFLIQDEGTGLPTLVQLADFQRALLADLYPAALRGKPRARNALYSTVKKAGKSTFLAAIALFTAVQKHNAQVFILATTRDQARAVLYDKIQYAVMHHPYWSQFASERGSEITFDSLGSVIKVVPNNWRAIEGFFPDGVFVDELHAFTVAGDRRAFDALVIPPQKTGCRFLTSYAGFEGESVLLEQYWKMGLEGEQVHDELPIRYNKAASLWSFIDQGESAWRMPWMRGETWESYLASLQADPSPTAFLRFAMNMWASSEQRFIDGALWDALEVPEVALRPPGEEDRALVVALDAATKRDCSAMVVAAWNFELGRVELVEAQVWRPAGNAAFDLRVMGDAVVRLHRAYPGLVRRVYYDPYQMSVISSLLEEAGVRVEEFTQTSRRVQADTNFRDVIVGKRLAHSGDAVLREHVVNAVARETSRGLRIDKEKTTLKIDAAVAASMAALGAMEGLGYSNEVVIGKNPFYSG